MLKGALQWSVFPSGPVAYIGASGSRFKAVHVLWYLLPIPEGWKAKWTLARKKSPKYSTLDQDGDRTGDLRLGGRDFNRCAKLSTEFSHQYKGSNRGPRDWEAEILTAAPTPPRNLSISISENRGSN